MSEPVGVDAPDLDGGELFQREDDKAETVANRLHVYAEQTPELARQREEFVAYHASFEGEK